MHIALQDAASSASSWGLNTLYYISKPICSCTCSYSVYKHPNSSILPSTCICIQSCLTMLVCIYTPQTSLRLATCSWEWLMVLALQGYSQRRSSLHRTLCRAIPNWVNFFTWYMVLPNKFWSHTKKTHTLCMYLYIVVYIYRYKKLMSAHFKQVIPASGSQKKSLMVSLLKVIFAQHNMTEILHSTWLGWARWSARGW